MLVCQHLDVVAAAGVRERSGWCGLHSACATTAVFFFFQAEDGIRDLTVTGVQTCALPISIFTNLTRDHLDYHETFDAYFAAKARLVGYLADDGLAVINADDSAWARLPHAPRRITFSAAAPTADVTARDVRVDAKGARFTLVTTQGSHPVALPLLGRFNVANALGVAACAVGLGVPPPVVAERLSTSPQVPGRMERIAVDPCVILRDYAHTPDALERALETVREVTRSGGRVIAVFGAGWGLPDGRTVGRSEGRTVVDER